MNMHRPKQLFSSVYLAMLITLFSSISIANGPCDDPMLRLYQESKIKAGANILDSGNLDYDFIMEKFRFRYIGTEQGVFYIDCDSGRVYDHKPLPEELIGNLAKISNDVKRELVNATEDLELNVVVEIYEKTSDETLKTLKGMGFLLNYTQYIQKPRNLVYGKADQEIIEIIKNLDYVRSVQSEFNGKIVVYAEKFLSDKEKNELESTGMRIEKISYSGGILGLHGKLNYRGLVTIVDETAVKHVYLDKIYRNLITVVEKNRSGESNEQVAERVAESGVMNETESKLDYQQSIVYRKQNPWGRYMLYIFGLIVVIAIIKFAKRRSTK